jgi:phosphopentomutase
VEDRRVFVIVIDSCGCGNAPDAEAFNDKGADTLRSIAGSGKFNVPVMKQMGLFNMEGTDYAEGVPSPTGCYGRMTEKSMGKDTTIGHWEIAGIVSDSPLPTYPDGFPAEVIEEFERLSGRGVLCNKPYSGTEVIKD